MARSLRFRIFGLARRRNGVVLALLLLASPAVGQDFYEAQLRVGETTFAAGQFRDAADYLRIAAFGLMERPALLCEALAYQALADQAVGRREAVDQNLRRMAGIARHFPECRQAHLEPARRQEFEALVRRSLGPPLSDELLNAAPVAAPQTATRTPVPAAVASPSPMPGSTAASPPSHPTPTPAPVSSGGGRTSRAEPSEELDREPQLKSTTKPGYPATAERAGVGGIVLLRVLVSPKGEPVRVEVARGVRSDLDEAAVSAVRQWTFEPGRKNGAPVTAWMTVAVPFEAVRHQ